MIATHIVRRRGPEQEMLRADLCIVGAGISGVACAVTAARLGRQVILIDSAPWVGGQAVGVPIGTIAGLYSAAPPEGSVILSPLFAEEILAQLQERAAAWQMYSRRARTVIVVYDEGELERILEHLLQDAGVTTILGATAFHASREGDRLTAVSLATRFGTLRVEAPYFVDASGDAALTWLAGAACRVAQCPIYGTQIAVLEGVRLSPNDDITAIARRAEDLLRTQAARYGLTRRDSRVFLLPQRQLAVLNATHHPTPLDPVAFWRSVWPARQEAEHAARLLQSEYPEVFGEARLRRLGHPGIRQTRTIVGRYSLTAEDIRHGKRFPDAIARVAWPIELHDTATDYRWEPFSDGHSYTIPFRALQSAELDNVLAIGRCIDADPIALSSARVMGPCIAMGVAAAHAVDLVLQSQASLDRLDMRKLQERLRRNLFDRPQDEQEPSQNLPLKLES